MTARDAGQIVMVPRTLVRRVLASLAFGGGAAEALLTDIEAAKASGMPIPSDYHVTRKAAQRHLKALGETAEALAKAAGIDPKTENLDD